MLDRCRDGGWGRVGRYVVFAMWHARLGGGACGDDDFAYMMMGMKMEGRSFLRRILVSGSKRAYDTKKMVRVAL